MISWRASTLISQISSIGFARMNTVGVIQTICTSNVA